MAWKGKSLITVGRVLIAIAAIFFGVQHFLHPLGVPGVPLAKQMPTWIPARAFIDYLTGAFLIVGGVCFLLARKTRVAATYLGTWILLLVVVLLRAYADRGAGGPEYGGKNRGPQLLRRHASIWRNDSFACPRHDGLGLSEIRPPIRSLSSESSSGDELDAGFSHLYFRPHRSQVVIGWSSFKD